VNDEDQARIEGTLRELKEVYRNFLFLLLFLFQRRTADFAKSGLEFNSSSAPPSSRAPSCDSAHYAQLHTHSSRHDEASAFNSLTATDLNMQDIQVPAQIRVVEWLANLKQRLQVDCSISGAAPSASADTDFFLGNQSTQLPDPGNPFHLPNETTTKFLFQCYYSTVHVFFPIVSTRLEDQVLNYYNMMRNGTYAAMSSAWYASVLLVLSIGGKFTRLTGAEWHADTFDEFLCVSRAHQLSDLIYSDRTLTQPDLHLVQVVHRHTIYVTVLIDAEHWTFRLLLHGFGTCSKARTHYISTKKLRSSLACDHVMTLEASGYHQDLLHHADTTGRAWVTVGKALRFALAIGLHSHERLASANPDLKQIATQTWWSLYNLETLLCTIVGSPCMLNSEDITITVPSALAENDCQQRAMHILDSQVRLATFTQEVMSGLYAERRAPRPWEQLQATMASLIEELDAMTLETAQPLCTNDLHYQWLKRQHGGLRILISHPSLRRIERCIEKNIEDFTRFDLEVATSCIQTAQQVTSLLPAEMDREALYRAGPWWTIVHSSKCSTTSV
jgi:hypothetical protein